MIVKSNTGLQRTHCRTMFSLVFVAAVVVLLVFSGFVSVFSSSNGFSSFALGASNKVVSNETELKDAINNAPFKTSTIITLNNDISLSATLIIPANKDITIASNKATGFYKLIGAEGRSTITVEGGGILRLDTHLTKQAF